jgi:hypothetical protein
MQWKIPPKEKSSSSADRFQVVGKADRPTLEAVKEAMVDMTTLHLCVHFHRVIDRTNMELLHHM